MGCWFGFNYTFTDLLAAITQSGFGGWVMCVCAEGINSSLNRPSHAHGFPVGMLGNGLISSQAPMGCQVSRGRAKAHMENNLAGWACPPEEPQPVVALCSAGCFYSSKVCSVTEQPPLRSRGRKSEGFWSGVSAASGVVVVFQREASRKGECAWLRSNTRAAGREDADYNNKQMPGIDYHTAVRAGSTKGGDPQRRLWRLQQDPLLDFFLLAQRKLLFRRLLMGLGFSVAQHLLGKAKRTGGAWLPR